MLLKITTNTFKLEILLSEKIELETLKIYLNTINTTFENIFVTKETSVYGGTTFQRENMTLGKALDELTNEIEYLLF